MGSDVGVDEALQLALKAWGNPGAASHLLEVNTKKTWQEREGEFDLRGGGQGLRGYSRGQMATSGARTLLQFSDCFPQFSRPGAQISFSLWHIVYSEILFNGIWERFIRLLN